MKSGIYNKVVYWLVELEIRIAEIKSIRQFLSPTQHYRDKAAKLKLPDNCYKVALYGEVVEAEYDNRVTKIVTRIFNRYNRNQDLCCAIAIDDNELRVKAVWLNDRRDKHYTLNRKNYIQNA